MRLRRPQGLHAAVTKRHYLGCRLIHTYCPGIHDDLVKFGSNSKGGRGGMTAKMQAAWMAAQQGCSTIIANGKASDNLLQVGGRQWPLLSLLDLVHACPCC